MVQLLVQPQYQPMPVEQQVVSIFAGNGGYLDKVETTEVQRFEREMHAYLIEHHPEIGEQIRKTKLLTDDLQATLTRALDQFAAQFK
jgi:F-type H+-transporting ATPase subunit alpha